MFLYTYICLYSAYIYCRERDSEQGGEQADLAVLKAAQVTLSAFLYVFVYIYMCLYTQTCGCLART